MQRGQESPDAVKVRTLPVQVAAHLTRRIVSGEVEDGRGPSELDISREFGVSRVVARETLKILASLDIVDVAQGRRVVVRPPAEWDYLSPLLIEWMPAEIVGELLQELHQMRVLLEPELAAMAAVSVTEETLDRLRGEIDRMAELEADPDAYLEVDHEFHMEICRAADNRILDRIMYSARWLGTASRRITNEAPAALCRATADHTEIYQALVARDPDRARAAMRKHLSNNSTLLAEREKQTKRAVRRR
ncbi:DNA-binding transcriptional regulator, FadR family [Lentzea xinjiangensis]|uniref:DNA-binding transcriptional regulator, FadR family n=1 Tax=Lentzea xinjiangensis TaxID=402600 RepID=A0A1H9KQ53_9PSEU|nr:FCD domain-containing protein [Lentzea xinjiangensis]SER01286.1 DNA-binding transcriptional regulator, FadR family [Lentzea xinjiangensis]